MEKLVLVALLVLGGCAYSPTRMNSGTADCSLDHETQPDPGLQVVLEKIDREIRSRFRMESEEAAVGIFDLKSCRVAFIHPDRIEYAASVPKIGILLAYFHHQPEAAENLDSKTQLELGQMIKVSSNEMATRFSTELGLDRIQNALDHYQLYQPGKGGGLWVGKHYGKSGERRGDPVANHSHAATIRQLLRFYLLLEQDKLVSARASRVMREIFRSPEIPHDAHKFVKGLEGRGLEIRRKWGTWENWRHDSAVVVGPGRHYLLAGLTHHPRGDDYLQEMARAVDDYFINGPR